MSVLLQNNAATYAETVFSAEDDAMWSKLYKKQSTRLKKIAGLEFLTNLEKFNLPKSRVPELHEISERLFGATGWKVSPVNGLIGYAPYFSLLQQRLFPAAMFMRKENEENLSKDPDFFHEIFGHCTMLLSQNYADFMQRFAELALTVAPEDQPLFSRLIWFTTETALIKNKNDLKIFGSSVLSSYEESCYAIYSNKSIKKSFDIISIFREPYRADILQKVYYIIDDTKQIYEILDDIPSLYHSLETARQLGEFMPYFKNSNDKYANIGHCNARIKT